MLNNSFRRSIFLAYFNTLSLYLCALILGYISVFRYRQALHFQWENRHSPNRNYDYTSIHWICPIGSMSHLREKTTVLTLGRSPLGDSFSHTNDYHTGNRECCSPPLPHTGKFPVWKMEGGTALLLHSFPSPDFLPVCQTRLTCRSLLLLHSHMPGIGGIEQSPTWSRLG